MGAVGTMTRWTGRYPMTPNLWALYSRLTKVVDEQMRAMMLPVAMTPTVTAMPAGWMSPTIETTIRVKVRDE